jgi:FtsH-binding integral membrane protein
MVSQSIEYDSGMAKYMNGVFSYMAIGTAIMMAVSYLIINGGLLPLFVINNSLTVLGWITLLAPLPIVFGLSFMLERMSTTFAITTFFTLSFIYGLSFSPILALYTATSVINIFLATTVIFASLALYGYTTKRDLKPLGMFLFAGVIGLLVVGLINIFLIKATLLQMVLSSFAVLIFSGLVAVDVQNIKENYNPYEDMTKVQVIGALQLYLNFINIFINLLQLFGNKN